MDLHHHLATPVLTQAVVGVRHPQHAARLRVPAPAVEASAHHVAVLEIAQVGVRRVGGVHVHGVAVGHDVEAHGLRLEEGSLRLGRSHIGGVVLVVCVGAPVGEVDEDLRRIYLRRDGVEDRGVAIEPGEREADILQPGLADCAVESVGLPEPVAVLPGGHLPVTGVHAQPPLQASGAEATVQRTVGLGLQTDGALVDVERLVAVVAVAAVDPKAACLALKDGKTRFPGHRPRPAALQERIGQWEFDALEERGHEIQVFADARQQPATGLHAGSRGVRGGLDDEVAGQRVLGDREDPVGVPTAEAHLGG